MDSTLADKLETSSPKEAWIVMTLMPAEVGKPSLQTSTLEKTET